MGIYDADLRIFSVEFVPEVETSDAYKRWARTSPGDRGRWEVFRDALLAGNTPAVPVMSTRFGRGLIAAGKEHMSITRLVGMMADSISPPAIPLSAPANLASVQAAYPAGSVFALNGSFGNQTFTQTKAVTFQAAAPGSATLGDVYFNAGAGSITLEDLTVGYVELGMNTIAKGAPFPAPVTDITLRRIDGRRFAIYHARRTRIYGGDWGLTTLQQTQNQICSRNPYDGANVPYDTLVDGAYIHNFGMTATGEHSEGIQCWAGNGTVIRNCTFQYCGGTGSITIQAVGEPETPLSTLGMVPGDEYTYFAHSANYLVYNNVSLDTVRGGWTPSQPYLSWYDLQGEVGLPGTNWVSTRANNTFPRLMYVYGRNGAPASDTGAAQRDYALPNPAPPPNWPPA